MKVHCTVLSIKIHSDFSSVNTCTKETILCLLKKSISHFGYEYCNGFSMYLQSSVC